MFTIDTDCGQIHFSRNVIYQICIDAVESCGGNVAILNFRGRGKGKGEALFQSRKNRINTDDIIIEETERGILLTIYVVIRFGTSISSTAKRIIDHIYEQTEEVMGERPVQVKVINTGTASRDIVSRNMEFSR